MEQLKLQPAIQIDVPLVESLIADQFPQWADLSILPVPIAGHDNRTFRLGDKMSVRIPGAIQYAAHIATEWKWLPILAPHLPLPIPTPLALGEPTSQLPWHWLVNNWLRGDTAVDHRIDDLSQFANDLAMFLTNLRIIEAKNAPQPGQHNFFRGGSLHVYNDETRQSIAALRDRIDARAAIVVWESALEMNWRRAPVWLHGDIAVGNLLIDKGKLCGVIDFGQLAAGDPACDVTIAWTLFREESRETFRNKLSVDEDTWMRGRGWALWKAMLELRRHRDINPSQAERWHAVIHEILSD